ncbi:hypothetical protein HAX54_026788, partial [Datura stramonium]|nr:hypothetical protein [Datura stramonium]
MVWSGEVAKPRAPESMGTPLSPLLPCRHVAILAITASFGFCIATTLKGDIVLPHLASRLCGRGARLSQHW